MPWKLIQVILIILCELLIIAIGASAGEPPVLKLGSRIRITTVQLSSAPGSQQMITGRLKYLTETDFTIETSAEEPPMVFSHESIESLELSYQSIGRGEGAVIGLGIGMALGMLIGLLSGDDDPGIISFDAETKGILYAGLLAPVGALIGLAAASREQWYAIPSEQIRLGSGFDMRLGNSVSVAFRF